MSTSLDYFSRGITRAFAKRQAEQAKQQTLQIAQKVDGDAIATTTNTTNTINQQSSDEQYRVTIIEKMINHIRQKDKTND